MFKKRYSQYYIVTFWQKDINWSVLITQFLFKIFTQISKQARLFVKNNTTLFTYLSMGYDSFCERQLQRIFPLVCNY